MKLIASIIIHDKTNILLYASPLPLHLKCSPLHDYHDERNLIFENENTRTNC